MGVRARLLVRGDVEGGGCRLARRLTQLYAGLVLFAVSEALLVRAGLGLLPWDVLHQGLARRTGLTIGAWVLIVSVLVLLAWVPLRQRPGWGTVSNVLLIGPVLDFALYVLPPVTGGPARVGVLVTGIGLNAVATALYIGAALGPGPRDGLMTALAARGHSLRTVRTVIEAVVLSAGWLLGGTVGVGTLLYALAIGPLVHLLLPLLAVPVMDGAKVSRRPPAPALA